MRVTRFELWQEEKHEEEEGTSDLTLEMATRALGGVNQRRKK
jgi:hypothetical protein